MRGRVLVVASLLLWFAGCAEPGARGPEETTDAAGACGAPPEAVAGRGPHHRGVTLFVSFRGVEADAWACNEGTQTRWLLERTDDCRGSWRWTYTPPNASVPEREGPEGHYGGCDDAWQALAPGHSKTKPFSLEGPVAEGATWTIALMVYDEAVMLTDAGGGEVRASFVFSDG